MQQLHAKASVERLCQLLLSSAGLQASSDGLCNTPKELAMPVTQPCEV